MNISVSQFPAIKYLPCLAFFMIGFYQFKLSILLFLLCYLIGILNLSKIVLCKKEFYVYICFLFFTIILYTTAYLHGSFFKGDDKAEPIAVLTFLFLAGPIFLNKDILFKKKLLTSLVFGYGFHCLVCIIYNMVFLDQFNLYGNVFNPFTGSYENSPKYANLLLIFSIYVVLMYIEASNFFKVFFLILLLIITYCGIATGSRTFLLFSFIGLLCVLFLSKNKILYFFIILLLLIYASKFLDFNEFLVFQRISEKGIESSRWDLYSSGFQMLIEKPLGGGSVDYNLFNTHWYHNVFLDIGRISGIIPVLIFLFITLYCAYLAIKSFDYFSVVLFFIVILIMQQDVIISGIYPIFLIYVFLCMYISSAPHNSKVRNL